MTSAAPPPARESAGQDAGPDGAARGRGGGWPIGRYGGIPIYVSPAWLGFAVIVSAAYAPSIARTAPELGSWSYLVALAFAVLLSLSVLAHEFAHAAVALRLGIPVRRITLHLLGGATETGSEATTPGREFAVAVAGPVLSLALGGAALLAAQPLDRGSVLRLVVDALAAANLIVGVFNLLPGLPLDGGWLVRAGVWKATGRRTTGTIAAAWVGRGLALLLFVGPLLLVLSQGRSPATLQVVWFLLLAGFIWAGATATLRDATLRRRLTPLTARGLARRAIPVAGDLPLAEALRRAEAAQARGLVVVDTTGAPIALVHEAAVAATPPDRRPWVPVASVARHLDPGLVLSADLTGQDLLRAVQSAQASEYLLQGPDGAPYGVLSAADLERAMAGAR